MTNTSYGVFIASISKKIYHVIYGRTFNSFPITCWCNKNFASILSQGKDLSSFYEYIEGLVQEGCNSIANALELRLSRINLLISSRQFVPVQHWLIISPRDIIMMKDVTSLCKYFVWKISDPVKIDVDAYSFKCVFCIVTVE